MSKVSIIIPNLNGWNWLSNCLKSLVDSTFTDYDIIVVDNGSNDGSAGWIEKYFPDIKLILNETNQGFAKAINQGIRVSQGQYIVTLNNDTLVEPTWLSSLVDTANQHPEVGMFASKMLVMDCPNVIDAAGLSVDRLGFAWNRLRGERNRNDYTEPVEVFGPCAAAALYRRSMLDEIGLFDEDFFVYLEDVDIAWRARSAGWVCLYVPTATVYHAHSATSGEGSQFKNFHLGRNRVWLLAKNYPFRNLWYCVPSIILYDLLAILYAMLIRGNGQALTGRFAGLSGWRKMWKKRADFQLSQREDVSHLSGIEWPWFLLRRYRPVG